MGTRTYEVTITGKTPLLMHFDNIEWADQMDAWKDSAENQKGSKKGDDRSPAWRWLRCLYHDGHQLVIPSDNIAVCMREGGAMVPVPGGKSGKTFKSQSQSGMMSIEPEWPLLIDGKPVAAEKILALSKENDFAKHKAVCEKFGFMLFVKRAKIGQAKHVRVRPRFDRWEIRGTIAVTDEQITEKVLNQILEYSGKYKGLCDWRPGAPKPGPHGMFSATVKQV